MTGLLIGLGFLSKYTNALEIISVAARAGFGAAVATANLSGLASIRCSACLALCTIPPIVWNAQHAWITLVHLRSRGSLDRAFGLHPVELLKFLGEHFLAYSPLRLSRFGLGSDRKLAPDQSAIQSTFSLLVRRAGVHFLFAVLA